MKYIFLFLLCVMATNVAMTQEVYDSKKSYKAGDRVLIENKNGTCDCPDLFYPAPKKGGKPGYDCVREGKKPAPVKKTEQSQAGTVDLPPQVDPTPIVKNNKGRGNSNSIRSTDLDALRAEDKRLDKKIDKLGSDLHGEIGTLGLQMDDIKKSKTSSNSTPPASAEPNWQPRAEDEESSSNFHLSGLVFSTAEATKSPLFQDKNIFGLGAGLEGGYYSPSGFFISLSPRVFTMFSKLSVADESHSPYPFADVSLTGFEAGINAGFKLNSGLNFKLGYTKVFPKSLDEMSGISGVVGYDYHLPIESSHPALLYIEAGAKYYTCLNIFGELGIKMLIH